MNMVPSGGLVPASPTKQKPLTNDQIRGIILAYGVDRLQQISSVSYNPTNQNVINIVPQNIGLCRGFLVKVEGTIANTNVGASGVALSRTNFGAANLLSNVVFNDTNNQTRHTTEGWHLNMINSAKQPMVFGGAYAPNVPVGYGQNYDVMTAPSSISVATGSSAVQMYYYVPLSYGRGDLRGAVWLGIVNAVAQLQLTINATPVVASGDGGRAVYTGNTGGWSGTVKITVWQDYIDQLPQYDNGDPMLPLQDLQTQYNLNTTTGSGMVVGQDFAVPYANWRSFLSTCLVYDQNGTYNAGTDINYFALQTANSSLIWKFGPEEAAFYARSVFMADPPTGSYYFDSRAKQIITNQFGNTQISVNPSSVAASSSMWQGFEYFTQQSQVMQSQSLPQAGG